MSPAAQGAALATIRLPRIAPIVMPADAAPCRRARIGRPRRRSIRAPSAFIVTSTTPPRKPDPISDPADRRRGPCVQERAQGRAERYRADHKDLSYAEGMGERAARRHRDQIGGGVGGENHAEGGGIDVGARENRARGAAPKADADPEREKHSGDRRVHASGIARRNLRGYGFQKSVGAPPSALRRATKASSASRRSGSNGGGA